MNFKSFNFYKITIKNKNLLFLTLENNSINYKSEILDKILKEKY